MLRQEFQIQVDCTMASSCREAKKNEEGESTTEPNWLALPKDLTQNILQRLSVFEIVTSACLVCPLWWNICKDPLMCRTIKLNEIIDMISMLKNLPYPKSPICRYAVKRSCGLPEDININDFGHDDLLEYIAKWYYFFAFLFKFIEFILSDFFVGCFLA